MTMGSARGKVFCVVPPTGLFIREDRCQTPIKHLKTVALRPPIDLLYATASLEAAGCECRLRDYPGEKEEWENFRNDLRDFAPDIVLLSITTAAASAKRRRREGSGFAADFMSAKVSRPPA